MKLRNNNWTKHYINEYVETLYSRDKTINISEYTDIKKGFIPKYLFKFYSPSVFNLINLRNQEIYFSNPRNFNDPFDCYYSINSENYIKYFILREFKKNGIISEKDKDDKITKNEYWNIYNSNLRNRASIYYNVYKILETKNDELTKIINGIFAKAIAELNKKLEFIRDIPFKICCFSSFDDETELQRNTTMWSHYTQNHKGFCVKYETNFDELEFSNEIINGLFPIKYTSVIPQLSPRELLNSNLKEDSIIINKQLLKTIFKTLITKSLSWNYEKEWRIIFSEIDFLKTNIVTIPFIKPKSIYLGCKIEDTLKKHLVEYAESKNIEIFQSFQNNNTYELSFRHISTKTMNDDEFFSNLKVKQKKMQLKF